MKHKAYQIVLKACPPALLPMVLRMVSRLLFWRYSAVEKAIMKENLALEGAFKGKTAYILATGPSMKKLDLARLQGKDCFSVSNFYLHEHAAKIAPKYHFVAPYHLPLVYEEYVSWLKDMDENLPAETGVVLGLETRQTIEEEHIFIAREVRYLGLQKSQITSRIDLTKTVMKPQSSPLMVLPFVQYLGYSKIVLIGCDHNTLRDYGGTVSNFYSPDKDKRSNATSGGTWDSGIVKQLDSYRNLFRQYQFYIDAFEKTHVKFVNTSAISWLDFVEFEPFEISVNGG